MLSADVVYATWEKLDHAIELVLRKIDPEILEFLVERAEGNMLIQDIASRVLCTKGESGNAL